MNKQTAHGGINLHWSYTKSRARITCIQYATLLREFLISLFVAVMKVQLFTLRSEIVLSQKGMLEFQFLQGYHRLYGHLLI